MILDRITSLQAVLAGAISTSQPEVTVDYIDWNSAGQATPPAQIRSALNSTSDVTILDTPATKTGNQSREPIRVDIYNKDTASVTVTVKTDDGATERILIKATLLTLESLHWERASGWYSLDANGNIKQIAGTVFTSAIFGTTTNDSAGAGRLGEYVDSVVGSLAFPTSLNFGDLTSISLSPGDWELNGMLQAQANGATVLTVQIGISSTSGNSATGLVSGSNRFSEFGPSASSDTSAVVVAYRVSLAATTTYYLKYLSQYSVATPNAIGGRLSARRMR